MPWKVFQSGSQFCVHKENPDGSMGEKVACHASRAEAMAQMRALYSQEGGPMAKGPAAKIMKVDEDEHLVFGWASVSATGDGTLLVDTDGEAIEPQELEKAVYDYVLEAGEVGEMHQGDAQFRMVESFVLTPEKAQAMGFDGSHVTGWWFGAKIDNDEVFKKVKDGIYSMFSIEGTAEIWS